MVIIYTCSGNFSSQQNRKAKVPRVHKRRLTDRMSSLEAAAGPAHFSVIGAARQAAREFNPSYL
jgi:hypothetical protein